jgi:hypothetical protein
MMKVSGGGWMVKSFLQRRSGLVLKPEQGRGLATESLTGPSPHTKKKKKKKAQRGWIQWWKARSFSLLGKVQFS